MPINSQDLSAFQAEIKTAKQEAKTATSRIRGIKKELFLLDQQRTKLIQDGKQQDVAAINVQVDQLVQEKEAAFNTIKTSEALVKEKIKNVQEVTDPRKLTALLDDNFPVFLMPVRLEARFMAIKHIARVSSNHVSDRNHTIATLFPGRTDLPVIEDRKELWVRIFPDDIFAQGHEEELTQEEITAGHFFWTNLWKAHQTYSKSEATENEAIERDQLGAWRGLISGNGQERAAWIAQRLTPSNVDDLSEDKIAPNSSPDFPDIFSKEKSWTMAPQTKALPDRFVVKLIGSEGAREVVGNPVADPLYMNISPLEEDDTFESGVENGVLKFPEQLKWLTDFHEAEKLGMAIRIPLSLREAENGFDKILILGLKHSLDAITGQEQIESLVEDHIYSDGGLSILAQGTKTNNDQFEASGYSALSNDDDRYQNIALQKLIYQTSNSNANKSDGQQLQETLGLSEELGNKIINGEITDSKEAIAMNQALWPVSFGYYLNQMLYPLVSREAIASIRAFFETNVLGRGSIPAIRIDDQPYGLMAVSAFRKWSYNNGPEDATEIKDKFLNNLLLNMDATWSQLANQVVHANSTGEIDDVFISIMSNHASSIEFYQRSAIGKLFLWNLHHLVNNINGQDNPSGFEDTQDVNLLDFFEQFAWLDRNATVPPNIFDLVFTKDPQILNGPLIDKGPLSEKTGLIEMASGWNYLRWLKESSYVEILKENFDRTGNSNAVPPTSLLYILLRQAILLEYQESGLNFLIEQGELLDQQAVEQELSNLGSISQESKKTGAEKIIRLAEIQKQNTLIQAAVLEHLKDFNGSEADRNIEQRTFESEKRVELAAELERTIGEKLNQIDLELVGLSNSEIFNKNFGDITANKPLYEHIETLLNNKDNKVTSLISLKGAISILEDLPTARLERCLAEHLDLGTYRLDAWFQGIATERLHALRKEKTTTPGTYLGAFGWLLDLRPSSFPGVFYEEVKVNRASISFPKSKSIKLVEATTISSNDMEAVLKTGEQKLSFEQSRNEILVNKPPIVVDNNDQSREQCVYLGRNEIDSVNGGIEYDQINDRFIAAPRVDSNNLGFIHAPSINQATAAAILRAAYESHKLGNASSDNAYAVNLNSKRVRRALFLLEGIKKGQELGALLGYQFERQLNEQSTENLNLNALIYDLRLAFPQIAGSVTETDETVSSGTAEAYNVIDGLKLLEAFRENPVNWADGINFGRQQIRQAIEKAIDQMTNSVDAIYDLMLAESVFQTTLGNEVRAGAALNVLNGKGAYVEPEIINTPRNYHVVTHRLGVQFDQSANGEHIWRKSTNSIPTSPRSMVAPKFNHWLSTLLPSALDIIITYAVLSEDRQTILREAFFPIANLEIEAIDLYYLLALSDDIGIPDGLSKLVQYYIKDKLENSDEITIEIKYKSTEFLDNGQYNIFSLLPLFQQIKRMVGKARILSADDLLLASEVDNAKANHPDKGWDSRSLLEKLHRLLSDKDADKDISLLLLQQDLKETLKSITEIDKDNFGVNDLTLYSSLRILLRKYAFFGELDNYPTTSKSNISNLEDLNYLEDQGKLALKSVTKRLDKAQAINEKIKPNDANQTEEERVDLCQELARALLGKIFKVFPVFKQFVPDQFTTAFNYTHLLDEAENNPLPKWFRDLSKTNKQAKSWRLVDLLSDSIHSEQVLTAKVVQLPLFPIDPNGDIVSRWIGIEYPEDYEVPEENLSLVFQYSNDFQVSNAQSGFIIDEWNEEIPIKDTSTGISVHYNSPNSEPPQVCLLAVPPEITGNWSWDDLMDTIEETIDWAKKRGVDPDILNNSPYAQVLPTVMAALTGGKDALTMDLKRNTITNPIPGSTKPIILSDYKLIKSTFEMVNPQNLNIDPE